MLLHGCTKLVSTSMFIRKAYYAVYVVISWEHVGFKRQQTGLISLFQQYVHTTSSDKPHQLFTKGMWYCPGCEQHKGLVP